MLFPFAFWSNEVDMFGRVSDTVDGRGEGFLFYSYASISGGALLIGLVAGSLHTFKCAHTKYCALRQPFHQGRKKKCM